MNGIANELTLYFADAYAGRQSAPSAVQVQSVVERLVRRERTSMPGGHDVDDVAQDVLMLLWRAGRLRETTFVTDADAIAYVRRVVVNRLRSLRRAALARPVIQPTRDGELDVDDRLGEEAERSASFDAQLQQKLGSWRPDESLLTRERSAQLILTVELLARLTPQVAATRRAPFNETIQQVTPLLVSLRMRELTVEDGLRQLYGDGLFDDPSELERARARMHTTHCRVKAAWRDWIHAALSGHVSAPGVTTAQLRMLLNLVENLNQRDTGDAADED